MKTVPSCAAGVPIFRVLPPEAMLELGKASHHRHFAKGELVLSDGEPLEHLLVVVRGRLKLVYTSSSGREQVVRTLEPGEFLGEMALFTKASLEGNLVAQEESNVCFIPRQAVQDVLRRHPEVALRLVEALAQRLAKAEELIADLGLKEVGQRLAAELWRLARGVSSEPAPQPGGIRLKIPVPWSELAFQLGTTPESLSRRLKSLAEEGIIRQEGTHTVVILDVSRLRKLAEA